MKRDGSRKRSLLLPTRRSALILAGAAGLIAAKPALGALVLTPEQTSGPYYPLEIPNDSDADLTKIMGQSRRASGEVIEVAGRVFDVRGHPLAGVLVEIWQADAFGAYHHPDDPNNSKADPGFQGYAVVRSTQDGAYRFRTIKPKSYKAGSILRTPHIHFHISKDGFSRLTTQMYFPHEKLNQRDVIYGNLGNVAKRNAATARIINPGTPTHYQFDIVV